MAYKYEDIFEMMRSTATSVVKNQDNWKDFLNTAANNYKRPFHNQLLIYAQKPEATACATFDYWNQKMGRFVKKGSKGIATIDLASQKKEILFDVSDTGSNTGNVVPIWSVTNEMYSPLGAALQEHFDTEVSSGDLVAVLFEISEHTVEENLPFFVESIRGCRDNSLLEDFDDINLEKVLKETLSSSLVYELLKRCDLEPEEYSESFNFSYINCFNSYETIAVLGSLLHSVSNDLFKDISLSVRSIEKIINIRENDTKGVEQNGSNLQTTRGLSDTQHIHSETGNEFREVRNNETNLSDEREDRGVHGDVDEGNLESALDRDRRVGDGEREQFGSADGNDGGRDRADEGNESNEVGRSDEQLPSISRGNHSNRDDLRLESGIFGYVSDDKHPELSLEFVLTNVLQCHRHMSVSGAEIQNYFLEIFDENQRLGFIRDCYNKDYTEILTPGDEFRVGYHANDDGLEVWIGAYLGATSRVVVPWNVVVNAIDLLIQNDEFLSVSEKAEIPTEEQQTLFAEEADGLAASTEVVGLSLPQQIIDEVICSGSNKRDSIYTICAYYKRNHTADENIRFLADEYGSGTGKGFIIDGKEYAVVFEENGIRIAEGRSVVSAAENVLLPWKFVDKRIKELLTLGRYISTADYTMVEDKLLDKTASALWDLCSFASNKEVSSVLTLDSYKNLLELGVRRKGFPEGTEIIKGILSEPQHLQMLLAETQSFVDACKGKEPKVRISGYQFSTLGTALSCLDDLNREVVEYPTANVYEPSYKVFITDDEVDLDLMGGSHVEDGKYRTYLYFLEPHTISERVAFLKDEYGTGGGNSALGGVFDAHHDHSGKGIVLSKGNIMKPYDTVTLSWNVVASKIDKLIKDGRYLSQKEMETLPDYEKKFIATRIYNFFESVPIEIERPYLFGNDRYGSIEEIANHLSDEGARGYEQAVFEKMQKYISTLSEDARDYQFKVGCLKFVERYVEGVSLFDIEARKRRGEWEETNDEPAPVVVPGIAPVDNTAYVYEVKPADVVYIGTDRFEVVSMENNEVVVIDVDFPLFTQAFALDDFNQKVKENPANDIYRVPIENVTVDGNDNVAKGDKENINNDVIDIEGARSSKESPVPEVAEAVPSTETVYRYYFNLKHPDDGYPTSEDNAPLNVVVFDERQYVEDFGIYSSGYVEYAKALSVDDMNQFDLMLYEPPIVSRDTSKRYSLGFGMLGNGTTVWNRLEAEGGDYKTVAHISENGEITYYDMNMPQEAIDKIQVVADRDKASFVQKMQMAAETLAEVEKRYKSPKPTINKRTLPCRNYTALSKVAGDVLSGKYNYMRFSSGENSGYEPLYIERIGENLIAMAHTYVQNGELMYDPEMVFSFDNEKEELQAHSYEHSSMRVYQQVYDDNGRANIGLQKELNSFLNTWLKNIIEQEQPLVKAIDQDGIEIDFTINKENPVVTVDASAPSNSVNLSEKLLTDDELDALPVSTVLDGEVKTFANAEAMLDELDNATDPVKELESIRRPVEFDFDEYLKIKDLYPDNIVAYQVGDFYEFLGEDAEVVAKELDLQLISRDVGLSERLAMCGVPNHYLQQYMNKLIQNGYNVAVHGFNEKSGKVITVDYETAVAPSNPTSSAVNVFDISDEDKLVFEPIHRQGLDVVPNSLSRENAVDYVIEDLEHGSGTAKEKFRRNIEAITLLKQLETEERLATPDEQKVLSAYVGWGGLSNAFDDSKSAWASEFTELKDLLTPEEYSSAKSSTLSAFYTSPVIIKFMYDTLENMGFKKGNILEPSCGVGNFIGMLPESLADSKVYGVELDSISGRIAQQLYQKQDIRVQGFEKTDFPDSFFDVAIGNVPFGKFKVNDKRYNKNNFLIHDYFFAKALDKVRPGGIVAFVTSKGTLDKESSAVREYIAQRAEFLGAVRLPDNAFKANAGTEVPSDIIFLQKRDKVIEIEPDNVDWVNLSYMYDQDTGAVIEDPNGKLMTINSYFDKHPECVLGEMKVESTQYGYDTTCKAREGQPLAELLKGVRFTARKDLGERSYEEQENTLDFLPADPNVRNFSYTLVDGLVYFRENSRMFPISFKNEETENRVKALLNLRDAVRMLIEMQTEDYSNTAIVKQRDLLNSIYDQFTKKYGLVNDRANKKAFESDSSYYLLAALENLDDEGKLKSKADIFFKRTIKPHVAITHVDTSAEALEVSISEKACVDIPYMMQLSGKSAEEIEKELTGVIFRVPNKLHMDGSPFFVAADEYLSGNVREKLKVAKEFAVNNDVFAVNVSALEKVQPKDLDASEISVRLGATWIAPKYVEQFMFELLDTPRWAQGNYGIKVNFADVTGEWFIENKTKDSYNVNANTTYGTKRVSAYKIIEDTLNLRDARVYDYVEDENGRKKAVLNRDETTIAQQKQEAIKDAFVEWIWKEPERREYLTAYYNEHFNNIRPREYDGSHLSFGGINPEIELRKHQLNAIARIIYGGNTLLAHAVGAGKTFEMIAAAQESKRLGLCSKSMFVVPNHLIEQFASDYMRLYPSANILCSTKKDFEPGNRKRFCSRIATGDYDAIIIGHSQFEKIPMSIDGQKRALQEQLDDVMQGIMEMKEEEGTRFSVKQLERTKKNIEAKLEKLNDESRKDDVVTFEELGVDRLFVDEAHYYKNLFLYTKMRNVAGIGSREAQKSSDLFMKCRYLDKLTGGKGVVFATGTPVSNSMTELYTMQRYLQYNVLCENGLQHFDSWASTFGETITAIELAPEGKGYRAKTRFARFYNLPELMATFKEVADVQTADMLHLPVPKAHFHTVSLQPSDVQKELVQELADRASAIHNKQVKPNEDNMLLVTNDGRKLALDQRLINPMFPDAAASKVKTCANNVFEIWKKSADIKGTQLVFCDLSTPKSGDEFDVYHDLKDKLVEMGIPKNEIAFIHNAKTDKQKANLFDKMRKGKVRILLGSTSKLGVGSNVQDKLLALHDIDCPWRPSDLEQRLGRIVRQGNNNDEVDIYRYVTKDTFDAYSWQLIENKQSFISQIFTSKSPARSAEDIDEAVLSYAEIKSLATGDPRIKEKMDLDVSVKRLKLLKQSYLREKYSLEDNVLKKFPMDISRFTDMVARCKQDIDVVKENTSQDKEYFFPMTVAGITYADKGEAGDALISFCKNKKALSQEDFCGEYRGFKLYINYDSWNQHFNLILQNKLRYTVALGKDKFGNITRINNALASLPERLAEFENKLANTYSQMENAKKQLEKPFSHEEELKTKSARLDQLNVELSLDTDNSIDIASSFDEKEAIVSRKTPNRGDEER